MAPKGFRPIECAEGYFVSSDGRIWSAKRQRQIRSFTTRLGYIRVSLMIRGKLTSKYVHRLVAFAFIPNLGGGQEVNHKNGLKHNNRSYNLEWCTHSENIRHADRTGLRVVARGDDHGMSKLTAAQIAKIRASCIKGVTDTAAVAKMFNVSRTHIYRIINNETRHAYA